MSVEEFLHNRRPFTHPGIIVLVLASLLISGLSLALAIRTNHISEARDLALHDRIDRLTYAIEASLADARRSIALDGLNVGLVPMSNGIGGGLPREMIDSLVGPPDPTSTPSPQQRGPTRSKRPPDPPSAPGARPRPSEPPYAPGDAKP